MRAEFVLVLLLHVAVAHAGRITILMDAFGRTPELHQEWGYAALIEVGGKRILFDTGNDAAGSRKTFALSAWICGVWISSFFLIVMVTTLQVSRSCAESIRG